MVAEEARRIMAKLGFRSIDEMVGHTEALGDRCSDQTLESGRAGSDADSQTGDQTARRRGQLSAPSPQDHGLEKSLDLTVLVDAAKPALENGEAVVIQSPIVNINRTVGTILSNEIAKRYGQEGLPDDTIRIELTGSAGQSLGAFLSHGVTIELEGDANDYVGKGLSGGRIDRLPTAGEQLRR